MVKKVLILILFFYILVLLQTSFLIHFWALNFVLLLVIFLNLFGGQETNFGLISGIIAGFFLDIFSTKPIGFHILILLAFSFFTKLVLRKYIQLPNLLR